MDRSLQLESHSSLAPRPPNLTPRRHTQSAEATSTRGGEPFPRGIYGATATHTRRVLDVVLYDRRRLKWTRGAIAT